MSQCYTSTMHQTPSDFQIFQTKDGSFTISFSAEGERMHAEEGAFTESCYLYGEAINFILEKSWTARFVSVGLGLGYNEIIAASLFLKSGQSMSDLFIVSFEKDLRLNEEILSWIFKGQSSLKSIYDDILIRASRHVDIEEDVIKAFLKHLIEKKQWILNGPLSESSFESEKFSCVFFDAFSGKTSPDLWTEEFLDLFFQKCMRENSIVSSYASNGKLKRMLKKNGFLLQEKKGFGRKWESTFAIRENH